VGLVDRKLVKQTVMTSVYGVTNVGARAQVEARLRERRADMKAKAAVLWQQLAGAGKGSEAAAALAVNASSSGGSTSQLWPAGAAAPDSSSGLTTLSSGAAPAAPPTALLLPGRDLYAWLDERDDVWRASRYLAGQTLDAIGEMFVSARAIMAWLADCAREVSRQGAPVRWVSPLGLPIMQPYQKLAMTNVHTTTQTFHVRACACVRAAWEVLVGSCMLLAAPHRSVARRGCTPAPLIIQTARAVVVMLAGCGARWQQRQQQQ
jgi:hypothetical protein